jgi:twitching motility protein PilU
MDMMPYLKLMAEKDASDMFFCTGTEPQFKINGSIRRVGSKKI